MRSAMAQRYQIFNHASRQRPGAGSAFGDERYLLAPGVCGSTGNTVLMFVRQKAAAYLEPNKSVILG